MLHSPSNQLTYCTVRIECELADGSASTGSGFYYRFADAGEGKTHVPAIVTNKHVLNGAVKATLYVNTCDAAGNLLQGSHVKVAIDQPLRHTAPHPDPNVDLCALLIGNEITKIQASGKNTFIIAINNELVVDDAYCAKLSALEDIVMVGYPNGIWDERNNLPILRRGITATPLYADHNGRGEFVIDAACFPGSSGSPVFLFNQGTYVDGNNVVVGGRVKLLGILYAGPQHTAAGEVRIIPVPHANVPMALTHIPNNLGYVIKAKRMLEIDRIIRGRMST